MAHPCFVMGLFVITGVFNPPAAATKPSNGWRMADSISTLQRLWL